ncbi:MAG: DNA helicase RecQ [Gammaproteobacteria bacterium]|nr:MAG: DNA helicase RecQ [Gammaproteobacteria bacterium]
MNSADTPLSILRETYGFDAFRGEQAAVIDAAMAGRDALVLMPTGAGKSVCYQIPMLARPGVGIVISPLIALMQDQVDALREQGVAADFLNSSLPPDEQRAVVERLRSGSTKLLYIAPERLLQTRTLDEFTTLTVALIAIDEAHCVSQWGHDFRQDYLGLHVLAEHFPGVPRMALTATADARTREEIVTRLDLNDPARFVASFDRPNIRYRVSPKLDPKRQLEHFLAGHEQEAGIVYCMSRKKVEATAEWLSASGRVALPYHAGLPADVRSAHQQRFLREDAVIMVATIAFGMGIDKPDVRFVVHLDLPKSMEAYYQETGRAGRDGLPAETLLLFGLQDVVRLRQMVDESESGEDRKREERRKLDALLGWCEITTCRRRALLAYFGEQPEADCGNCDICLDPPETFDATVAAQKLLSCVFRTGQRFGAAHVIDVLRGNATDKIRQHHHDELSTFGIGDELDAKGWRSVLRQLLVQGYLEADASRFGALVLTPRAKPLLRGDEQLVLRRDAVAAKSARVRSGGSRAAGSVEHTISAAEQPLWEALRNCRRELADEAGVPPYVIFHDSTLLEMLQHRPESQAELLALNGVGQTKLERFGDAFLEVLQRAQHEAAAP